MALSSLLSVRDTESAWANLYEDHLSRRLFEAVERGQTRRFHELLVEGANPDWCRSTDGSTALHMAAQKGRTTFILGLLHAGANVGAKDARGRTAHDIFQQKKLLFGRYVFCRTASSYDCLVHLTYLTRAYYHEVEVRRQMSCQRPPPDVKFEGIAVIHPGQEIDLGCKPVASPGLAWSTRCTRPHAHAACTVPTLAASV